MEIHGMKSFFNLILFAVCLFILLSAVGILSSYNSKNKMAESTNDAEFRNKRDLENYTNIQNSINSVKMPIKDQIVKLAVPQEIKNIDKNNILVKQNETNIVRNLNSDLHENRITGKVRKAKVNSHTNNVQRKDRILKDVRKDLHAPTRLKPHGHTSFRVKSSAMQSDLKPRPNVNDTAVKYAKNVLTVNKSRVPLTPVKNNITATETDRSLISQLKRKSQNHNGGRKRIRTKEMVGINSEKAQIPFHRKNKKRLAVTTLRYRDKKISNNSYNSHRSTNSISKFIENKIVTKSDISDSSTVTLPTTSIIGHQSSSS
ncbi:hypothetical protein LOTGIDRAFT_235366 [Lottia gigantea]|uniref:Uncharacterized protein n=1 Tax=Lottia gigantea TaxID=225164 RepID=V3ZQG0_LOTGI|nr:hypothetical protein LOTGIDRAFT_235366 [Lottia gigantea]ESO86577.1 hypothetical protein LOTGIDRAFT_235366 [Lottia gigantea]